VARVAHVPRELRSAPFTLDEARTAGLSAGALKSRRWRRIGRELYRRAELPDDPWKLLTALQRTLPPEAIFAGQTAAWLHGLDLKPTDPIEIAIPPQLTVRRHGLRVRRCEVVPSDTEMIRGLRATSPFRTLLDLCITKTPVESLIAIDMALHLNLIDKTKLEHYADVASGRQGVRRLRTLAEVAAPAASPMETRLRWLLITARLPRPEVQADIHDDSGRFVGRADLFYRQARLVIEFDGGNYRDRLVSDDQRQNLIVNAGFRILRFTATDVYNRADIVVAQVRGALAWPAPFDHKRRIRATD
jgi:very-short-patch-repair endonuclease